MLIKCPHCHFSMAIKGARPGRFTPACEKCAKRFVLLVPTDTAQPPTVSVLPAESEHKPAANTAAPHHAAATAHPTAAPRHPAAEHGASHPAAAQATAVPHSAAAHGTATAARPPAASVQPRQYAQEEVFDGPERLGGYEVMQKLGQGGMGAVYLARQVSLDRNVAVKVMNPEWVNDAEFVARFTREAYAAAQLTHHHVVQIHDIGLENDTHFFSMEFVAGQSLADLVKKSGPLDPELAAGYILQAARGLKFAHDRGMIHRDVKPENLLLNEEGIVKVADLGLVKTPAESRPAPAGKNAPAGGSIHSTHANSTMGTPAYMAPEQGQDAANVDARADIYSLGCTFYDLLVGRPPFEGKTVAEVLTKHASEPIIPPDARNPRVPKPLSFIIQKMTAKAPGDRYTNMAGVIKALEHFLGVESAGPFSPKEEHVRALEGAAAEFNSSHSARMRSKIMLAFGPLCLLLAIISGYLAATSENNSSLWYGFTGGFIGLGVLTPICYLLLAGMMDRTVEFSKFRQMVFGSGWKDWLKWSAGVLLVLVFLIVLHLLWIWIGFALAAVGLAAAFYFVVDRMVSRERQAPVDRTHQMLRQMRLKGLEEDALRQFACKYSGQEWEAFYEALFGYEAKISARARWGQSQTAKARLKFGAWRDSFIAWVDRRERDRKEERERRLLQKVEEKSLQKQGVELLEARKKAAKSADSIVAHAAELKEDVLNHQPAAGRKFTDVRALMAQDSDDSAVARQRAKRRKAAARTLGGNVGYLLMGPRTRFVLGVLFIAGFIAWLQQNDLAKPDHWRNWAAHSTGSDYQLKRSIEFGYEFQKGEDRPTVDVEKPGSDPLDLTKIKWFPVWVRQDICKPLLPVTVLFTQWYPAVAGLVLLASIFYSGIRISFFLLPAVVVLMALPLMHVPPHVGPLSLETIRWSIFGLLAVGGFMFGREMG